MLIPISTEHTADGVQIKLDESEELEDLTLRELNIRESVLEEFVRLNIDVLFAEGENLLIVGQQTRNVEGGRADLVAIDSSGNMVLIELKRDLADIVGRREPFEFQAVRYAASYATLKTTQDLVQNLYAPYIERHRAEFDLSTLSATELAIRNLEGFLKTNNVSQDFNRRQLIVLIAAAYDPQTLSACAWLAKNGIGIRCIEVRPLRHKQQLFFDVEQVIPPRDVDSYFIDLAPQQVTTIAGVPQVATTTTSSRRSLPRMGKLLEWGVMQKGSRIFIRNHPGKIAILNDARDVNYEGKSMPLNEWGCLVTGWSAVNIYDWAVEERSNKTIGELRAAYMARQSEASNQAFSPDAGVDAVEQQMTVGGAV